MSARLSTADTAWLQHGPADEPDGDQFRRVVRRTARLGPRQSDHPGPSRRPLPAFSPAGDPKPPPAAPAAMGRRSRLCARAPRAPFRASRPGRPRRAPGTRRRPDDDAARPQSPAVADVSGRRVRRGRGDHQPHAPLHRRWDRAGQGDAVADGFGLRCRHCITPPRAPPPAVRPAPPGPRRVDRAFPRGRRTRRRSRGHGTAPTSSPHPRTPRAWPARSLATARPRPDCS